MTPPTAPRGLVKPHRMVPPGGPQGPFWGLLSSEGYVVATQIVSEEDARLFASAPLLVEALEAVMYFWGRDPLAFGDEATINSLAGRFAAIADQCRVARNAALGLEDS